MALFKKNKKETSKEIEQAEKDLELVSLIKHKYNEAYSAKTSRMESWRKCKEAYTGDLFEQRLPDYKAKEISNYIFSTVETIKPIMLSNYPKTIALPRSSTDFTKAKLVQNALDFEWKREKMFQKLTHALHYVLVYGTAAIYLPWNGSENGGVGNVNAVVVSPFNLFPDPRATNDRDAEYIIYAANKPAGEIIQGYPEKAEEIKMQLTTNADPNLNDGEENGNNKSLLYLEAYIKDYAVETQIEDETDESGNPTGNKLKKTKAKYPNGRRIIIAGDVLLDDSENPYKDGRAPFVTFRCYDLPDSYWGLSEVEMLISPQEHMCKLTNSILENAALMGNPVWVLDKNSGVEKNSLTNRPGLVVRKNPGTEVKRDVPPNIPAYTMQMVDVLKSDIERISGIFDVTRGERPAGISAASAISTLQESSQGRIRLKTQLLEEAIAELGALWLSRMQQFWTTVRTVRVMGGNYKVNEQSDLEFQNAMQGPMGMEQGAMPMDMGIGMPMQGNPLMDMGMESGDITQNPNIEPALQPFYQGSMIANGKNYDFYDVSKDDLDGDYDIDTVAGSTMSKNRGAMLQALLQMAQTMGEDGLPMIDRQTLLENSDVPDVDKILQRFEALRQQNAEAAQADAQSQTEINAQSAQASEQAKMQTEQMKIQGKLEEKKMDSETKMVLEKLKSNFKSGENKENAVLEVIKGQALKDGEGEEGMTENGKDTKSLQTQQDSVQSMESGDETEQLMMIIQSLAQLPPEELEALARENPDIAALLEILMQVQSQMGLDNSAMGGATPDQEMAMYDGNRPMEI